VGKQVFSRAEAQETNRVKKGGNSSRGFALGKFDAVGRDVSDKKKGKAGPEVGKK